MIARGRFERTRDDFARPSRGLHPLRNHGNPAGHRNRAERPSRRAHQTFRDTPAREFSLIYDMRFQGPASIVPSREIRALRRAFRFATRESGRADILYIALQTTVPPAMPGEKHNGVQVVYRFANSAGFMAESRHSSCPQLRRSRSFAAVAGKQQIGFRAAPDVSTGGRFQAGRRPDG
jgi:hypothetical protein